MSASAGESGGEASIARGRLQALMEAGARTFAPSALAFAEGLLARGEATPGAAGARLIARAVTRTEALARELEEAKARAREAVVAAGALSDSLVRAIDSGDVGGALRAARRGQVAAPRSTASGGAWRTRLSAEARARGLSPLPDTQTPGALAVLLYTSSRDELSAMLRALRAQAEVPSNAGPYNPLAVAARTLARLSTLAPAYLTAIVGYLDELAPLLALPPLPTAGSRPSHAPPRRKGTGRPPRS